MNCTECGDLFSDINTCAGLVELGLCRSCYAAQDPCPSCHGRGWREELVEVGTPFHRETCEDCDGSGHRLGWPLSAEEHRDRHDQDIEDDMEGR